MEELLSRPCADAKVTCVINVLKNANSIKDTANKDLFNKSEKHFSWLDEILAEIKTTFARYTPGCFFEFFIFGHIDVITSFRI